MKKQTIAVDLDDVLGEEVNLIRRFINERYGLNLTAGDYNIEASFGGFWETVWGVDQQKAIEWFDAYNKSGALMNQQLLTGASETISRLKRKYDLVIVTARPDTQAELTHAWLGKHFPKVFGQVRFVPVWDKSLKITKAQICKEVSADYLIDDSLEHCALAAEEGITALLFGDYGWNRKTQLPEGVIRVKDWQAVMEFFDARA